MLIFVKLRVNHEGLSPDELWDIWEKEADAALGALEAGKAVSRTEYMEKLFRTVLAVC